jgi:hypothetical protein
MVWAEKDTISLPAVADYVWSNVHAKRAVPASNNRVAEASHHSQRYQPQILAPLIRRPFAPSGHQNDAPVGARLVARVGR